MENLQSVKGKVQTALAIIINISNKSNLADLEGITIGIEKLVNDYKLHSAAYKSVAFQELCGHVTNRNYKEALHWADVLHLYISGLVDQIEIKYAMTYRLGNESITVIQSLKSGNVLGIEITPGLTPIG